mmetsp:Transcript_35299/g.109981  ORF Transcript_35299/g.109981 Transcript_35299/m.109981 type:complete len:303 (+) Transcript_35299:559-1467(+)
MHEPVPGECPSRMRADKLYGLWVVGELHPFPPRGIHASPSVEGVQDPQPLVGAPLGGRVVLAAAQPVPELLPSHDVDVVLLDAVGEVLPVVFPFAPHHPAHDVLGAEPDPRADRLGRRRVAHEDRIVASGLLRAVRAAPAGLVLANELEQPLGGLQVATGVLGVGQKLLGGALAVVPSARRHVLRGLGRGELLVALDPASGAATGERRATRVVVALALATLRRAADRASVGALVCGNGVPCVHPLARRLDLVHRDPIGRILSGADLIADVQEHVHAPTSTLQERIPLTCCALAGNGGPCNRN